MLISFFSSCWILFSFLLFSFALFLCNNSGDEEDWRLVFTELLQVISFLTIFSWTHFPLRFDPLNICLSCRHTYIFFLGQFNTLAMLLNVFHSSFGLNESSFRFFCHLTFSVRRALLEALLEGCKEIQNWCRSTLMIVKRIGMDWLEWIWLDCMRLDSIWLYWIKYTSTGDPEEHQGNDEHSGFLVLGWLDCFVLGFWFLV